MVGGGAGGEAWSLTCLGVAYVDSGQTQNGGGPGRRRSLVTYQSGSGVCWQWADSEWWRAGLGAEPGHLPVCEWRMLTVGRLRIVEGGAGDGAWSLTYIDMGVAYVDSGQTQNCGGRSLVTYLSGSGICWQWVDSELWRAGPGAEPGHLPVWEWRMLTVGKLRIVEGWAGGGAWSLTCLGVAYVDSGQTQNCGGQGQGRSLVTYLSGSGVCWEWADSEWWWSGPGAEPGHLPVWEWRMLTVGRLRIVEGGAGGGAWSLKRSGYTDNICIMTFWKKYETRGYELVQTWDCIGH